MIPFFLRNTANVVDYSYKKEFNLNFFMSKLIWTFKKRFLFLIKKYKNRSLPFVFVTFQPKCSNSCYKSTSAENFLTICVFVWNIFHIRYCLLHNVLFLTIMSKGTCSVHPQCVSGEPNWCFTWIFPLE